MTSSTPQHAPKTAVDAKPKPLILIVDDVSANLHVLTAALRDDYRIRTALSGNAALELAQRADDPPDLILLDVMMPVMSGYDVLERLRQHPKARDIPVVFVTADTSQENEVRGLQLGAFDFLTKPVDVPVLRARVANLIEQQRLRTQLQSSELKLRAMLDSSRQFVALLDPSGRILHVNRQVRELLGLSLELVLNQHFWDVPLWTAIEQQKVDVRSALERAAAGVGVRFETIHTRESGEPMILDFSFRPVLGASGDVAFLLSEATDVTQQKAAEESIRHLANNDPLTGLPNRTLLTDRVDQAIRSAERSSEPFALMFLDLDRFKHINDTLGHSFGDILLREIGVRLVNSVRLVDTVARLGGDEFVLLLPDTTPAGAAIVAEKLLACVVRPCMIDNHELAVTPSIGIAMHPGDGHDFATLSKCADTAMYRAKREGRNTFRFYTNEMHERTSRMLRMEASLRQAIARDELSLHYQPQVRLADDKCVGVEALLRWDSAELGSVSPIEFIPLAEETGLILPIGQWVLRQATKQAREWLDDGLPMLSMAVNVSSVQLRQRDFLESIANALAAVDLSPDHLELELTESAAFSNPEAAMRLLKDLHTFGVRISIDDFGTGYSSLSYLKRVRIDKLKIDQSFVRGLGTGTEDAALIDAMIQISRSLKMTVIAEGVETKAQLEHLRSRGCDSVQGYYFSRPLPASKFAAWLRERCVPAAVD